MPRCIFRWTPLITALYRIAKAPSPPLQEKKMLDLESMQVTKDEEFKSQMSQLITESLKKANKERLRAPPVVAKGKKAVNQQKPFKKLIEQATEKESAKGTVILKK